jgi:histidyl-tRNA synthetase
MYDILPDEVWQWQHLEATARELFRTHGYSEIRTPILEETQLFARGIGESTDIVTKEMYTFDDRKGRSFTLRPEGTASIVRAYVERKLQARGPLSKLYYIGPMFRYERPQAGRNRQFFQIGAEAIGSDSPIIDFEIIELAYSFFGRIGFKNLELGLNSLGCSKDRKAFASILRKHFDDKRSMLCGDCRERLEKNPLRVLDCKVENCQTLAAAAPTTKEHLCGECSTHLDTVCDLLDRAGIRHAIDQRLVRGLDYYTRTVFEVHHSALGARSAICGGGRYDNLVEQIGGPPTPATGFSIGVEATLLAMEKEGAKPPEEPAPDAYICSIGKEASFEAARLATELRNENLSVELDYEGRSLKAQMKQANKMHARFALILGDEELADNSARAREMSTGEEETIAIAALVEKLKMANSSPSDG